MNFDSAVILKHEENEFKRTILESMYIKKSNIVSGNKVSFDLAMF